MKQKTATDQSASTVCYEMIETKARDRIQSWLQDLLEEEVTEFLGRAKSQRRSEDDVVGYRNGYGKPRRIAFELWYGQCAPSAAEETGEIASRVGCCRYSNVAARSWGQCCRGCTCT